ncbi:MAG TPA: carboxylesterase family protein [Caulobacteraceae bacterium]|jgi:para-nitrobenzyl esterase
MTCRRRARLALALALAASLSAQARPEARPEASIATGRLAGAVEDGVSVFRGVPFAAPPVGPLRWRPPQASAAWAGVREATRFGPACPQGHPHGIVDVVPYGGAPPPTSEDCLTLNVWAPAPATGRAPVMVFFHGGSGVFGAGSLPYYDGARFARDGVVLVTVNYRLGALGGFAHPALAREAKPGELQGNYALMDQMAALRWVRRNVSAFGGDPANVTIFGESAGGISVLNLVTTPSAWGLFQKAIVESGGGWFPPGQSRDKAEAAGVKIAAALGVPATGTAAQLRRIPAQALADTNLPQAGYTDPRLSPEGMTSAIDAGRHAAVPLMIGVNSGEDSLLDHGGGVAKARATIKPGVMAQLRQLYGGVDDDTLARDYFRDALATAPARWVTRKWSVKAPAYLYRFEHVDEAALPRRTRAPHGGEIFYVFETLGKQPASLGAAGPTPGDERLAADIHARWVAFARTGSPNPPGRPHWPACSPNADRWMVFAQNGPVVRDHLMQKQLDWHEARTAPLIVMLRLQAEWARLFRS